jgi:tetratricopeptide (TPR) repeat protein
MNFPHLSLGYLGKKSKKQTISSKFYTTILGNKKILSQFIVFPQRIPKKDFFKELLELESQSFYNEFIKLNHQISDEHNNCVNYSIVSDSRKFFNYSNLLLRYGLCDEVYKLNHAKFEDLNHTMEYKYLIQNATIEKSLNRQKTLKINGIFLKLCDRASHPSIEIRLKILIYTRLIVCAYRHANDLDSTKKVLFYAKQLLEIIQKANESNFNLQLITACAYRGLAMVKEYNKLQKQSFIENAEMISRNLISNKYLERILLKENLYTCLQTLSKWNQSIQNNIKAVDNIQEMISIDPYDSTAYTELGLIYMKDKKFSLAAENFKLAVEQGPPAVGMNNYFCAKSLQNQGHEKEAIVKLYETTLIDVEAISPWLDILKFNIDIKNKTNTLQVAKYIFSKKNLKEQLDNDELSKIKSIIN